MRYHTALFQGTKKSVDMTQLFNIHPDNPQPRLLAQAAECLRGGGIIVYPTDSCYALGCHIGDYDALEKMRAIRRVSEKHHFTLLCRDLSEIATYARVDNSAYRTLKALTPGPYTFILSASREVPRRLQNPKRKTIGIRVPANPIARLLLDTLGEPMLTTSLVMPNEQFALTDPQEIRERLNHVVSLVIDGGACGVEETTVVDLSEATPQVLRRGKGDTAMFE